MTESLKLANIDKDGKIDYKEFAKVRHRHRHRHRQTEGLRETETETDRGRGGERESVSLKRLSLYSRLQGEQ